MSTGPSTARPVVGCAAIVARTIGPRNVHTIVPCYSAMLLCGHTVCRPPGSIVPCTDGPARSHHFPAAAVSAIVCGFRSPRNAQGCSRARPNRKRRAGCAPSHRPPSVNPQPSGATGGARACARSYAGANLLFLSGRRCRFGKPRRGGRGRVPNRESPQQRESPQRQLAARVAARPGGDKRAGDGQTCNMASGVCAIVYCTIPYHTTPHHTMDCNCCPQLW